MRTKLFFILALLLSADIALADSFTATGSLNLTIGTTGVSGTAGLLYGDGSHVQSLPGAVTSGPTGNGGNGWNLLTLGSGSKNVELFLSTDGTVNNAAVLTLAGMATAGDWNNFLEVYTNIGFYGLPTYIANDGGYYSTVEVIVSGHFSSGAGPEGHSGGGYSVLNPAPNIPSCIDAWSDITGPAFLARDNVGIAGEYSFMGMTAAGVSTIALDARDTQVVFGNQTVGSGQIFTGNAFFGSVGAANLRFGGADAAAPVAQTISFQNVLAGTSNTAGVNTIFKASAGTGTGAGGSFLFQTALPGSSGTTQNAFTTVMTIDGASGITLNENLNLSAANIIVTGGNIQLSSANIYGWSNGTSIFSPGSGAVELSNNGGSQYFGLSTLGVGIAALGNAAAGDFSGTLKLTNLITAALTYSTLPSSPTAGQRAFITDANTTTYYATVSSGGGSSKISVLYNGSNWVVD
jgi:hypothetical protein